MAATRTVRGMPWPTTGQGQVLGQRIEADLDAKWVTGVIKSVNGYRRYLEERLRVRISASNFRDLRHGYLSPLSVVARRAAMLLGVCPPTQWPEDWAAMEGGRGPEQG